MLMLVWTLCSLLILSGAECLGGATDVACDAVGLIQSRVQQKQPKVYVYELPSRFQNKSLRLGWHNFGNHKQPEHWTSDLVFGGPPHDAEGYSVWTSNTFLIPIMLHYRLVHSPQRTFDVDEADVFFIPVYQFLRPAKMGCEEKDNLVQTLMRLNPKLKDPAWVREKGPRHLLASSRKRLCKYMYEDKLPQLRSAVRIVREISDDDSKNRWNQDLPWRWYQFPHVSAFHGPHSAIPALQRPRGMAQWLWGFSGTAAGDAEALRRHLIEQCHSDSRCSFNDLIHHRSLDAIDAIKGFVKQKLHTTFCVEPPGDSLLRKSLLDSIGAGCIPVLFEHQSLDVYQPFVTPEEWAKATLFIPEVQLVDRKDWSKWATATFHVNSSWKELQKLHPEHSSLLDALHPMHSESERRANVEALFPKQSSFSSIIRGISKKEVRRKQAALAKIAPRLVIGLDDSNEDAVSTLVRHIASRKSQ